MSAVIRIVCWADGRPTGVDGQYLADWSQDVTTGVLNMLTKTDPAEARHFASAGEALTAWREQSVERPLRSDGKPNRPLTALTVEVLDLDEALKES